MGEVNFLDICVVKEGGRERGGTLNRQRKTVEEVVSDGCGDMLDIIGEE